MSASLAVQRLLHATLTAVPELAVLTGIYDGVPPDAAAPYLTLGPDLVTDWSHKSGIGHEHRVQLTIWDDRPGTARVKHLAGAAEAAIRTMSGARDGHRIVSVVFLRGFVAAAPDAWTQGVAEFRIRTEQI